MSTDHLLRSLSQNAQTAATLHQQPPLFAALTSFEDPTGDLLTSFMNPILHCLHLVAREIEVVDSPDTIFFTPTAFVRAVYTDHGMAAAEKDAAVRSFHALGHRLLPLWRDLPDSALRRLGLHSSHSTSFSDWVCLLFHLAWHFPEHFARGAVARCRLLVTDQGDRVVPEDMLQLYPVGATQDRFPGVIYSWFPRKLDLVTATEWAIDLLRSILTSGATITPTDEVRNQFKTLHQAFSQTGQLLEAQAGFGPFSVFEAKILRLDSSVHTPPATEWAGIQAEGAPQVRFLSRNNVVKECGILHGPFVDTFLQLADRAGALLPEWPAEPYPALLEDAEHWQRRVQQRNELAGQSFWFMSETGEPPHGKAVPTTTLAEGFWWATSPSSSSHRLVTDHRGNVERWIGFLFHVLKEMQPAAVEIRIIPEGQAGRCRPWNAMLTLRDMNLFQASARALELVFGWRAVAVFSDPQGQPEPNCIVTPESESMPLTDDLPTTLEDLLCWLSSRVQWLRSWHLSQDPKPIPPPFLEAIIRVCRGDPGVIPTEPEPLRCWANERIWRFSQFTLHQTHACLENLGIYDSPVLRPINPLTDENCLVEALDQLTALRAFVALRAGTFVVPRTPEPQVRSDAVPSVSPDTIVSLGERVYMINGTRQIVNDTEDDVLQAYLGDENRPAVSRLTEPDLIERSGVNDPMKVLRVLQNKYEELFKPALDPPQKKGAGWGVRIIRNPE